MSQKRWFEIPVRLIVSTGRTGTQFLAEFFNDFLPSITGLHEPKPEILSTAFRFAVNQASREETRRELKVARKILLKRVINRDGAGFVEANNRYFSLLTVVREIFEDLRIVHIVRDGRDYVRSGMSRPKFGHWYSEQDPFAQKNLRLKASMFPEDPYYDRWPELTPFQKIAWRWVKKDSFIRRDTLDEKDSLLVRFEEIFAPEKEYSGLQRILDFFNLDGKIDFSDSKVVRYLQRPANETAQYSIPDWPDWSMERKMQFDEIAGEYMEKYGYYDG